MEETKNQIVLDTDNQNNIKLISDFSEVYDAYFDLTGKEFRRISTEGYSKEEQFRILKESDYFIPLHGTVRNIINQWSTLENKYIDKVVIYDDVNAHKGEGKRLVNKNEITENDSLKYCSEYIGDDCFPSIHYRLLQIGKHRFHIKYWSNNDWRSNCGEGDCQLLSNWMNFGYHKIIKLPLFAIDFVLTANTKFALGTSVLPAIVAIDLNNAPGISGFGIEEYISNKEIAESIKQGIKDLKTCQKEVV